MLNVKAIQAFQIIVLFELEKAHQTRLCFKLRDNISIKVMQNYVNKYPYWTPTGLWRSRRVGPA